MGEGHVFAGAESGKTSKYGWVKESDEPFDLDEFIEWTNIRGGHAPIDLQEILLKALIPLRPDTPVAVDFMPRGLPPTPVIVVHKVIFQKA